MKTAYLQTLRNEIRIHNHITSEDSLTQEKWSKGSYKLCSKIIGQALLSSFSHEEMMSYGTSVSYKTLEHIFKNKYIIKNPIDPRSLCTLTKLVKFIGYDSWKEFTIKVDSEYQSSDGNMINSDLNLVIN